MDLRGTALVLTSAASFGVMAILAKDDAVSAVGVNTVLAGRFLLAALVFAVLAAARGVRWGSLPRRAMVATAVLGAVLYATESTVYLSALGHMDASIASLILCTYPVLVLGLGVALRREQAHVRQVAALALALGGALVVLSAGAGGHVDGVGLALTAASTALYAAYVVVADGVGRELDPIAFGALLCGGAGVALALGGAATGRLHPAAYADAAVARDVVLMALVSTVLAVATFFAGMRRIGATPASTVASAEPLFTVGLAAVLLGEHLTPVQLAGGAVLVAGILLAQRPAPDSLPGDGAPARTAPAAAARPLTLEPA